ncbi:MAG TPA: GNAT family N-acetyltransferase [Blastocatellia bacterium]|nr:GNAT family N-acetyltransferase [Blastocatellia bacterium]
MNQLKEKNAAGVAPFTLRPARPDDVPFLYELYCSTRAEEVAAWGWGTEQRETFLKMQFGAQQRGYRQFAGADHRLILLGGRPVGRILVSRSAQEIRLADIALLPENRNCGIGSLLIRELQAEAKETGKPLRLRVITFNRAARLYERLGFSLVASDGSHCQMEWLPE